MNNTDLRPTYDQMHTTGPSAWFSDGINERQLILSMLPSWRGLHVLEIGCGEGDLAAMIGMAGAEKVDALDYAGEAINRAQDKFRLDGLGFQCRDWRHTGWPIDVFYDVVVMQGVLEHFDEPFKDLKLIIADFLKPTGTLITTSPGFINPRGYVWMALHYLAGAKMSKTDLHFLHPWEFEAFAQRNDILDITIDSTDFEWACGDEAVEDFKQRLPLVMQSGGITRHFDLFNEWFSKALKWREKYGLTGATIGYKMVRDKPPNDAEWRKFEGC